jgi:hypothetical protein
MSEFDALMFDLQCNHSAITQGRESKESIYSRAMDRINRLQAIIDANLHRRCCRYCYLTFYAKDNVVPYCLCPECGSQDTRRVK